MCGIAGIFGGSTVRENMRQHVLLMTRPLVHRGPDAEGVWCDDGIALGHRRLSVLELSAAGAQPMHSACGRYVLVFNGEIYNHLSLRAALARKGDAPAWRGHSDTETLVAAIRAWGLDAALQQTAGMFALALWDREDRCLSLARDRMGEKPLYWGFAGGAMVWGSELKAINAHPHFDRTTANNALAQYLRFGYVPSPYSIYRDAFKVEPGTIVEVHGTPPQAVPRMPVRPGDRNGSLSVRRYWSLTDVFTNGVAHPLPSEEEADHALEQALSTAVRRQLLADVPVGAFLSGGIDSSTITALMQRESRNPARTFTIGFDNPAYDESPQAEAVARHLRSDHNTVRLSTSDALDIVPQLPSIYDEPFADSSQIPTYLVSRVARAHVTVALTGDAGDELFGGYNRYLHGPAVWRRMARVPAPLRHGVGRMILATPQRGWDAVGAWYNATRAESHGIRSFGEKVHRVADRLRRVGTVDDIHRDLTSIWAEPQSLLQHGAHDMQPISLLDDSAPQFNSGDAAGRMMFQDMRTYLPDDLLCKVDRAAMAVSLETRVPFLDPDVISVAARIPSHMKIRGGSGKWPLRRILYKHVPAAIIDRPKAGFAVPVGEWLRGPLRAWAEDLLSEDALARDDQLHAAPIRNAWAEHRAGKRDHAHRLWTVLMWQAWNAST